MAICPSKFEIIVTDIQRHESLLDEFSLVVPVVRVDGNVVAESTIDIPELRQILSNKLNNN
jgi:predicted thioredoxin/glutaredoxin